MIIIHANIGTKSQIDDDDKCSSSLDKFDSSEHKKGEREREKEKNEKRAKKTIT